MKKLGKVPFGVLCMILLFTFSQAAANDLEDVVPNKKSKIEWTATTTYINNRQILDIKAVGYNVYICDELDKGCKENVTIAPINKEKPIRGTNYPLPTLENGQYIIGVRALLFKNDKLEGKPVEESEISWSCDPKCTFNNNPFRLKVIK